MSSPAGATGSAGSTSSSYLLGAIACGLIALGLYAISFYTTAKFLGTTENWNDIQSKAMPQVLLTAIGGGIMLFIACSIYFSQEPNPLYMSYAILGMACFALCFSYASIAISAMTKASA